MFLFSCICLRALIAQSVEHGANNARVVGSSPTGSIFYFFYLFYDYPFFTYYLFYYLLSHSQLPYSFFICVSFSFVFLSFFFPYWLYVFPFFFFIRRGLSSVVEQLTPDQPVSGSIPLVLTFLFLSSLIFSFYVLILVYMLESSHSSVGRAWC